MNHVCIWSDCAGFSWRPKAPGKPLQRNRLENSELPSGDAAASFFSGVWTVAFWCCYYQTPLSWEFLFDLSMAGLHVQCEPCIHCPTEVQFFVPAIARVIVLWADCQDPMATGEPARHQVWPADAPVTSPLSEGFSFNVSTRRWLWLWGYEYLVQKIELHMNLIFDRPVYCRQTVFRLKFRLFCRLYTVGRL